MRGQERDAYLLWERLNGTQKHMILMYLYRVETEPMEELENYIETYRFREYGITRDQLPVAVTSMRGIALVKAAYAAIGKVLPDHYRRSEVNGDRPVLRGQELKHANNWQDAFSNFGDKA